MFLLVLVLALQQFLVRENRRRIGGSQRICQGGSSCIDDTISKWQHSSCECQNQNDYCKAQQVRDLATFFEIMWIVPMFAVSLSGVLARSEVAIEDALRDKDFDSRIHSYPGPYLECWTSSCGMTYVVSTIRRNRNTGGIYFNLERAWKVVYLCRNESKID